MPVPVLRLIAPSWDEAVTRAGRCLAEDGLALLPAEGVYGLHVRADRRVAVARLEALKGSGSRLGFITLIARPERWTAFAGEPGPSARSLIAAHWPGPLTLILSIGAGMARAEAEAPETVALRCPGSAFLRAVVEAAGGPLYSTSANRPGGVAPARIADAILDAADLAVDAGPLSGEHSTIARVDPDGAVSVLRRGAIEL